MRIARIYIYVLEHQDEIETILPKELLRRKTIKPRPVAKISEDLECNSLTVSGKVL